jgi:hypothetical protein
VRTRTHPRMCICAHTTTLVTYTMKLTNRFKARLRMAYGICIQLSSRVFQLCESCQHTFWCHARVTSLVAAVLMTPDVLVLNRLMCCTHQTTHSTRRSVSAFRRRPPSRSASFPLSHTHIIVHTAAWSATPVDIGDWQRSSICVIFHLGCCQ